MTSSRVPAGTPGGSADARAAGRGSISLLMLQTLGRALGLVFVTVVARQVAPSQFGRYSIVTAIVLFAGLLADLGTTAAITRAVSRDPDDGGAWLSGTVFASVGLGVAAYAASMLYVVVADYPRTTVVDTSIGALALPFTAVLSSVLGALDGSGRITHRAVVTFAQTAIVTVGGAVPILLGASITAAIVALPVSAGVSLVIAVAAARRVHLWSGRPRIDGKRTRLLLAAALPFAALAGFSAFHRRFDLVLLSVLSTRVVTADYDLALRVTEALGYLGTVVSAPALFLLSRRLGAGDLDGAKRAFSAATRAVYLVGLPVSAGLVALHQQTVDILFGRGYRGAAVPLAILGGQLWLELIGIVQGSLVVAGDHVRRAVGVVARVTVVLVVLDVALIVRWDAVGAAVALALFQVVNVVAIARFNRRATGMPAPWPPMRAVIAAGACGAVAWAVADTSTVAAVAAGAVTYAGTLIVTGGVSRDDVTMIRRLMRGQG